MLSYPITGLGTLLGIQEAEASRISRQSAHERGKVVDPTHRPLFHITTNTFVFLVMCYEHSTFTRNLLNSGRLAP